MEIGAKTQVSETCDQGLPIGGHNEEAASLA